MTHPSAMAAEIAEVPRIAAALREIRAETARLAAYLDLKRVPLALVCGRGSSGHAGVFLRYLIETRLGLPVSAIAPSVTTALARPLKVADALFIVISQSGGSPDIIATTKAAREGGALTVAMLNAEGSPLAAESEFVLPLKAGPEHSVAATKSVIASMIVGAELVAHLAGDTALLAALDRLPARLEAALSLDWSAFGTAFAKSPCGYVTGRGFGLGPAREIALKGAETLRMPILAYSSAELLHGPRAALDATTPVLALRFEDETAASVDHLVADLRAGNVPVFLAGGKAGTLPWLGDDHPVTDAIAMLVPVYRAIEAAARARGFDPDRPPHLNKVTRTL
ncbi:MAG: SIS domain-containing protein [Proteobacteria bacterium]|nr:SIS domain-containing protein [Pseudomonadota bacterium]